MTFEWKPPPDEDDFSHALWRVYAAHWQAVNKLQLENGKLRTTVATPWAVSELHLAHDELRTPVATPRTPPSIESNGAGAEWHRYLMDPLTPKDLMVQPACWSTRGASSPRSPRSNVPPDPLQVLASGGGGDLLDNMEKHERIMCPDVAVSESLSTTHECVYELRDQWQKGSFRTGTVHGAAISEALTGTGSWSRPEISLNRTQRFQVRKFSLKLCNLQHIRCIDPESGKRIFWDMCSIALLVYDCIMLPLSFFKFGFSSFTKAAGFASTIFWTSDILASFGTGFYRNGVLQTSPGMVAHHYVKTWLCFDVVVIALEWILIFLDADDSDGASSISGIRLIRFIRFTRLTRAIKLSVLASKLSRRVNNVTMLLLLRLFGLLSVLVMINHATAALWYTVGEIGNDSNGWMASVSFESRSQAYLYLSSLHWSITNFHGSMEVHPRNEHERAFACLVLLVGIVVFSTFVGSLTNSISMIQKIHEERTRKYHLLCKYLKQHSISGSLSAKAKRCFEEQMLLRQQDEEIAITSVLSGDILDELYEEARSRHIMSNTLMCLFCSSYPRVVRQLCRDAMAEQYAKHSHRFFFHGDACECVTILMTGTARYIHKSVEDSTGSSTLAIHYKRSLTSHVGETVHDNRWICEMVLWTHWVCCGWLGTITDCHVLTIDQRSFGDVVKQYEHARQVACDYARHAVDSLQTAIPSDLMEVHSSLSYQLLQQRSMLKKGSFLSAFSFIA